MAHKTLVNGTAYEITGGKTLIDGTAYSIKSGKTLVGGTAYEVGFGGEFVPLYNFGSVTIKSSSFLGYGTFDGGIISQPSFDLSSCNALVVNGDLYSVRHYEQVGSDITTNGYTLRSDNSVVPTEEYPFAASFIYYHSNFSASNLQDKWKAYFYGYESGTYEVSIGRIE